MMEPTSKKRFDINNRIKKRNSTIQSPFNHQFGLTLKKDKKTEEKGRIQDLNFLEKEN